MLSTAAGQNALPDSRRENFLADEFKAGVLSTFFNPDDDVAETDASLSRVLELSAPCTDT